MEKNVDNMTEGELLNYILDLKDTIRKRNLIIKQLRDKIEYVMKWLDYNIPYYQDVIDSPQSHTKEYNNPKIKLMILTEIKRVLNA